jgi:hypothetical protein
MIISGKHVAIFAVLCVVLFPLVGCDIVIRRLGPTPTPPPPPPPGSACSVVSIQDLQAWLDDKISRFEQEVVGGTAYIDVPQMTNCMENTAFFQVRVGYERPGLVLELGVWEGSFELVYYPDQGNVCLDLQALVDSEELSQQGLEQAGAEIKVAEVQNELSRTAPESMPTETRQQLESAVETASIQGDPQSQGIGTEGAEALLDWALEELLKRLNGRLAELVGACIPVE